jgi:hypothetical protein
LLIADTIAITCDAQRAVLQHTAILIRGNCIVAMGPTA